MLRSAATSFDKAAAGVSGLHADACLSDAAASVPSLQTGAACRKAQSEVAAETAAVADGARQFSENLATAARWYAQRDQVAAEAIKKS